MAEKKQKSQDDARADQPQASAGAEGAKAGKGKPAVRKPTAATGRKKSAAASVEGKTQDKAKVEKPAKAAKPTKAETPANAEKPAAPSLYFTEENGYGFLLFDAPEKKVNILTSSVMTELDALLDQLAEKRSLKALLIMSAKDDNFIAGVDVNEIKGITDKEAGAQASREGHRIYGKLAALPYPTIAVINGTCVGGGLELALACKFRIARDTAKTRIGLPEINLGILPGWGGTQRLPRLIGIQKAFDYILTGRLVNAQKAYRDGVIDRVIPDTFPAGHTRTAALDFAREIQNVASRERIEKRRRQTNLQTLLLEKNFLGRKLLFDQARKQAQKATHGQYPAPLKAIEAVEKGRDLALVEALEIEATMLGELIVTEVSKNLINVFWLTEALKKDTGSETYDGPAQPFNRVGVLGAGVMGGGIAQLLAYNDRSVRMKDINLAAVAKGMEQASKIFAEAVARRRMKPKAMQTKFALISGTTDYSGFEKVDLVIEAVVENLEIKQRVFAEIDKIAPAHAILASNTSSLPVTEMAAATARPDKVAGLHFFNPVHRMPLVEVIRGKQSSEATIVSLVAFARAIGKTPIVVKDSAGFLVNRILGPYLNEASMLLAEGQAIEHIDGAILKFGMPMGPLHLFDEVGIDVAYKVSGILEAAFGDRVQASPVVGKVYASGRYGKKTGKGFYKYAGKEKRPDAEIYNLLVDLRQSAAPLAINEIQERCVLLMINEAAHCLEDEVVRQPRDVDIGMIFGTGFPPFRGGLLRYADKLGSQQVVASLEKYAEKHGARFGPAGLLQEMAKKGKSFF